MPYFPTFRDPVFPSCPWHIRITPSHTSDLLALIKSKNSVKNTETLTFKQFSDCLHNFAPHPLPILAPYFQLVFLSQCIINRSWISLHFCLTKVIEDNPRRLAQIPPPPTAIP